MGEWAKRVRKALNDPKVMDGIATLVARYAKDHIAKSRGRGPSGASVPLKPLASVKGEFWTRTKPRDAGSIKETRTRTEIQQRKGRDGRAVAKQVQVTEYLVQGESYRANGKPLRDTGETMRQMGAKGSSTGGGISITVSGPLHAIFHEMGFETSGPNYIPLTRRGKQKHSTGNNPANEGLVRGKDFTMAWHGVTVPKRPFMVPTNDEWVEIGKSIRMGLARILKGKT